jgi:hypothetical protein
MFRQIFVDKNLQISLLGNHQFTNKVSWGFTKLISPRSACVSKVLKCDSALWRILRSPTLRHQWCQKGLWLGVSNWFALFPLLHVDFAMLTKRRSAYIVEFEPPPRVNSSGIINLLCQTKKVNISATFFEPQTKILLTEINGQRGRVSWEKNRDENLVRLSFF